MSTPGRRAGSVIWELNLAERIVDPTIKVRGKPKVSAKCLCKMDQDNPEILCNKVMVLTDASTTTLRHHIKEKHPVEFGLMLVREQERKLAQSNRDQELEGVLADLEGNPDDPEPELTQTPGVKRTAEGEDDMFATPKSKKSRPDALRKIRRSVFNRLIILLNEFAKVYIVDIVECASFTSFLTVSFV
jgi:hypothetical protein